MQGEILHERKVILTIEKNLLICFDHFNNMKPGIKNIGQALLKFQTSNNWGFFLQRSLELIFSVLLMVIAVPLGIAISGHIYVRGGFPVFLARQAVGKHKQILCIYSFRMHKQKAATGAEVQAGISSASSGGELIFLGGLMRRLHLDSLPCLLNIANGGMSFIGPKPLSPEKFSLLSPEEQEGRALRKPGLTGR